MESLKAADPNRARPHYATLRFPYTGKPARRLSCDIKTEREAVAEHLQSDEANDKGTYIEDAFPKLLLAFLRPIRGYGELAQRAYLRCRDKITPCPVLVDFPRHPSHTIWLLPGSFVL